MNNKLLLVLFFCIFNFSNSQQFSLDNIKTDEQIEIALDSAYQWMEVADLEKFTKNYFSIDNAIERNKNQEFKARFSAYKASFYCYLYDSSKFKEFLEYSLEFYQKQKDREMLVYVYNLKGIYESYMNLDHGRSIKWHEKAINLVKPGNKNFETLAVDGYFNLAVSNAIVKDWDATYKASIKSIALAKKYNQSRLPRMYYHKGLALLNKNNVKEAIKNFKLSENLVKETELASGKKVFYKDASYLFGFSEAYKILGDSDKSATYLREYNSRMGESVSVFSKNVGIRIQKHSELLIDLAKRKQEKAQEELKKSEDFFNLLLLGFAILIIGGLLILNFLQRKHKKLNIKKNRLLTSKNSELIYIKEEAENALKVKTDFLNSITHELRTPLYAINSITHMIKENGSENINTSQIEILSFSGDHLLRFINDVIDFNLGANNFDFQNLILESINLEKLIHKIKKTIKFSLVISNENNFVFDFDPAIPQNLMVDSLKLSRIIINLLNNASKYTKNGQISLTTKQLNTNSETCTIEFSVKDNGEGISKEQLNEIDIAFSNNLDLVKRLNNKASGLGLGLVMVNRLLKLYSSELIIKSEKGNGTTMSFQVSFKIDRKKADLTTTKLKNTNNKKKHILIVDDNKINQMVTSKIIKKLGHTYDVAAGGKEAITLFNNNNYDLILMDIMMPEMNGFQATEIIKSIDPRQKIIALTAMSIRENKHKFESSGFETVIEKPFVMEKFEALIA